MMSLQRVAFKMNVAKLINRPRCAAEEKGQLQNNMDKMTS